MEENQKLKHQIKIYKQNSQSALLPSDSDSSLRPNLENEEVVKEPGSLKKTVG